MGKYRVAARDPGLLRQADSQPQSPEPDRAAERVDGISRDRKTGFTPIFQHLPPVPSSGGWKTLSCGPSARLRRRRYSSRGISSPPKVRKWEVIHWVSSSSKPLALNSPTSDTSAIFALLIAVYWLKEPFDRPRVAAVLLAAAAVPLLRLG